MDENPAINVAESSQIIPPKRGRGRPRKYTEPPKLNNTIVIRGRGRPRKYAETPKVDHSLPKRGRGRPRTCRTPKIVAEIETPPLLTINKKHRGSSESPIKTAKTKPQQGIIQPKKCAVFTCKNESKSCRRRRFHLLPRDTRRPIWMYLAGLVSVTENQRTYICENHFKNEDYIGVKSTLQLSSKAVPSLHLPLKGPILPQDEIFKELILNPSNQAVKLHETYWKLKTFKKKDRASDLLLSFYVKHPSAYKLLKNSLGLLSPLQLKKEMYRLPIDIKFTSHIYKKLRSMDDRDKICFVTCVQIAVEMKLFYCPISDKIIGLNQTNKAGDKLADSAIILIAHGVHSDWHIPLDIVYVHYSSSRLNTINYIEQTYKTYDTLDIIGVAWLPNYADYPNTWTLFKTPEIFKLGSNCHSFYDIQFLLKLAYFNMKSFTFSFGDFNASLNDLQELFAIDSKRKYPLAPNLNANNVNLANILELTNESVAEVFTEQTAGALRTYTGMKILEAEGTAIFVENISLLMKLFDSKPELTKEKLSIIYKLQEFLKTLIKLNEFTHYFVDSVLGILNMYLENPEFFSSKYLLNNSVHKFVDNILTTNISVTCMSIEKSYRKCMIENLLKPVKKYVEFDESLNLLLEELNLDPMGFFKWPLNNKIPVKKSEYKLYMLEKDNRIIYVAGYILKKCYDYHDHCSVLKKYINSINEDDKLLSKSIEKEIKEGQCVVVKNDFVEFVEVLELYFLSQFPKLSMKDGLIKNLVKSHEMHRTIFTSACSCFPLNYVKELFIRIRLDFVITYNNVFDDAKCKALQNISL